MTRTALISTLLVATVAAGCGSGDDEPNKAGAPVEGKRQVLTIEATDAGNPEAQYLARRIEARSGGSLRVRLDSHYDSRLAANEVKLARAIRAGREDFGLLPARAWPTAGVPAFAVLQAPFVITTYDTARAAMAGPAGQALSDELEKAGIEPLALVPTQLRRLLAKRPLTTPESFRGIRLRIVDNATTAQGIEALGGVPKQGLASDEVLEGLQNGRLDGAESAPQFIISNGYGTVARRLTGYALMNRVDTIVAAPSAMARLSPDQQRAVRDAAADTAGFAATQSSREAQDVAKLCRQGVRVDVPTPGALQALADATEPVHAALDRDPETAPILRLLRDTPGAGPQPLPAPKDCTSAPRSTSKPTTQATLPSGAYVTTLTKADYNRFGEYGEVFTRNTLKHTHTFRNGRVRYTVSPEWGPKEEQCPCGGSYTVDGDRLTIDWDRADFPTEIVHWSYYRGELTFRDVEVHGASDEALYQAHPWRRVR
jgi:TRAP-type transport system periplasmic protein